MKVSKPLSKVVGPNTPRKAPRFDGFMKRFIRDEDGALVIFGVYIFIIILMVGGIGVDVMHFERDRANLQYTMDRAVLAAASLSQEQDPTSVVNEYFTKAGLSEYITSIQVTEDAFHRRVSATVSASIATQFMHMTGLDFLQANVRATAEERVPNAEISLVLDISGSMRTNDRVSLMKEAAQAFTSAVLARNESDDGVQNDFQTSVNIVPFSGQTNPGATMFEYLGGVRFGGVDDAVETNFFPEWPQDISNIVFRFDTTGDGMIDYSVKIEGFPENDIDMFDKDDLDSYFGYATTYIVEHNPHLQAAMESDTLAKMVGASIKGGKEPTSYYSALEDGLGNTINDTGDYTDPDVGPTEFSNVDMTIQFGDFLAGIPPNDTSSCIEMSYSDFLSTGLPADASTQTPHFVNWDYDEATQNWGWCPEDDMAIQYAQKDESALNDYIENLRLFDGTGTNYGMKYALALLDPNTQPAFAHLSAAGEVPAEFQNRPLAWNAETSSKNIVLLTDGRISTQIRPTDTLALENSDTELTTRPDEDSVIDSSSQTNLQTFLFQCELAKSKGVTIYTVALETSAAASAEIRECASSPSHFFEVTGSEIIGTFVSIASSIQQLRLVE